MSQDWQELQDKVNEWADATFGTEIDADEIAEHIVEEAGELVDNPFDPINLADIIILVVRLAHHNEMTMEDLRKVSEAKLTINSRDRVWKKTPDGRRYETIGESNEQ